MTYQIQTINYEVLASGFATEKAAWQYAGELSIDRGIPVDEMQVVPA